MPPLEAMKCGIPVVVSDNSSLPEVIGDIGFLGNSNDYKFFSECLIKLLNDNDLYEKMKVKSIHQASKFTPEEHIKKNGKYI